jgi:hypothetical protein
MTDQRLTELLYRGLGEADDIAQAMHLELFAEAIQDACRLNHDNQHYYISKHLGPKGKAMILAIADYSKRRDELAKDEAPHDH